MKEERGKRKRKQNQKDRHWQHEDTGMVCISWYKPSKRYYAITKKQYDEYLAFQKELANGKLQEN